MTYKYKDKEYEGNVSKITRELYEDNNNICICCGDEMGYYAVYEFVRWHPDAELVCGNCRKNDPVQREIYNPTLRLDYKEVICNGIKYTGRNQTDLIRNMVDSGNFHCIKCKKDITFKSALKYDYTWGIETLNQWMCHSCITSQMLSERNIENWQKPEYIEYMSEVCSYANSCRINTHSRSFNGSCQTARGQEKARCERNNIKVLYFYLAKYIQDPTKYKIGVTIDYVYRSQLFDFSETHKTLTPLLKGYYTDVLDLEYEIKMNFCEKNIELGTEYIDESDLNEVLDTVEKFQIKDVEYLTTIDNLKIK